MGDITREVIPRSNPAATQRQPALQSFLKPFRNASGTNTVQGISPRALGQVTIPNLLKFCSWQFCSLAPWSSNNQQQGTSNASARCVRSVARLREAHFKDTKTWWSHMDFSHGPKMPKRYRTCLGTEDHRKVSPNDFLQTTIQGIRVTLLSCTLNSINHLAQAVQLVLKKLTTKSRN